VINRPEGFAPRSTSAYIRYARVSDAAVAFANLQGKKKKKKIIFQFFSFSLCRFEDADA
jgi:hypothetical protein